MSTSRFPAALRQLLLRLHFYAGVLIAPFLVVAAVTGLLYASSYVVEDFLYDDLRTVAEADGEPVPLSDQVRAAAEARPDWAVTGVRPADGPEDATGVLMDDGTVRESGAVAIVYVDPYTGGVQGDSTTYGSSHAGPFREWAATFHRTLHLGDLGRNYSELAASWLWVIVSAGLVLWLWRRRRPGRVLWPRRGSTGRAKSLSWHGPIGLWLAVLLLFLSATGLTWSRYAGEHIAELREQLSWTTPSLEVAADGEHAAHGGGHEHAHNEAGTLPVDSLDAVYETARGAGLEGPLELTLPQVEGGRFTVAETQRSYPVQQDRIAVAVDESGTARVSDELRFADWPFMAQVTNVAIALHMGLLFGLANQIFLAAAILAFLTGIFLGYRMWWQRRTRDSMLGRPYPRGALRALPWWTVAVAVPLVALVGWFLPLFGIPLLAFLIADVLIGLWRRRGPEPEQPSNEGVTRRTALGAATVTAAVAGGVGYGLGSGHEHDGDEASHDHGQGGVEPFFGEHQPGIATPAQAHAMFTAFDLSSEATAASLRELLERWSEVSASLMRGETPPRAASDTEEHFDAEAVAAGLDPARLTVTFGLGPGAFAKTGLESARPTRLVELPEFDGDRLNPAWSGGDLLLQICGDDLQVVSNAFLELRKRAVGSAALRWVQHGFVSAPAGGGTPRNLMGFKDGTLNPEPGGAEFDERVWAAGSEPDWFTGGTYLVFRKIRMRLPNWSAATAEEQNLTIGKDRDTGAPLSGGGEFAHPDFEAVDGSGLPAVPADSHLALTHMAAMFRRGYNYDYGYLTQEEVSSDAVGHEHAPGTPDHGHAEHPYDAGLLFAAYQSDPQVFIDTQEKMAGGDRLMEFIVAEGSGIFAVPPGAAERGFVGEGLFEE